jgi:hypothetical protein
LPISITAATFMYWRVPSLVTLSSSSSSATGGKRCLLLRPVASGHTRPSFRHRDCRAGSFRVRSAFATETPVNPLLFLSFESALKGRKQIAHAPCPLPLQ